MLPTFFIFLVLSLCRDEIYCQICKQLLKNNDRRNRMQGWILLSICLGIFPPTDLFRKVSLHKVILLILPQTSYLILVMPLYLNLAEVLSCCLLCPVLCFTVFRELSPQRAIWLQGVLHWAPETYRSQWTKKRVALLDRATGKKQKVLQYGAEVTVYLILTFGQQQQNLNCGWKQLIFFFFLTLHWKAAKTRKPIDTTVAIQDGRNIEIQLNSSSTSEEVCQDVANDIGLKDTYGFSLYIRLYDKVSESFWFYIKAWVLCIFWL